MSRENYEFERMACDLDLPPAFRLLSRARPIGFALFVAIAFLWPIPMSWADIVRQQASRPGPNEVDTADHSGQIGGIKLGRGYQLFDLRCGPGDAIVGLQTRRGSVLDYLQIRCARPTCDGRGCQWGSSYPGPSAGNSSGGNSQPLMQCRRNEMLSGVRGESVAFTIFDYAADLDIECAPMVSSSGSKGVFSTRLGNPSTGFGGNSPPDGARGMRRTGGFISCATEFGYGATAVSVGESDFVNRGQRVVQAVSLYCPKAGRQNSTPSNTQKIIEQLDRCLREESKLTYYISPDKRTYAGSATYSSSTIRYDPNYLDRQPPYLRTYQLADAFAAYVLDSQQRKYPVQNETRGYRTQATDIIVGFLSHCLWFKDTLLQNDSRDPRIWFTEYRGVTLGGKREEDFSHGWALFGMGLPRAITMEPPLR